MSYLIAISDCVESVNEAQRGADFLLHMYCQGTSVCNYTFITVEDLHHGACRSKFVICGTENMSCPAYGHGQICEELDKARRASTLIGRMLLYINLAN